MSEKKRGATTAAVGILALVGLANWAYAGYRMLSGREDNLPLIIAGLTALTLALVLFQRK